MQTKKSLTNSQLKQKLTSYFFITCILVSQILVGAQTFAEKPLSANARAQLLAGSDSYLEGEPAAQKIAASPEFLAVKNLGLKEQLNSTNIQLLMSNGNVAPVPNKLSPKQVEKIRAFAKENLSESYQNSERILYAFGGPDFSYPHAYFPNMKELILFGLEPVGSLLDVEAKFKSKELPDLIRKLTNVYEMAGWTYFITSNMLSFIPKVSGVVNVLAASIAAHNYRIIDITPVGFNERGEMLEASLISPNPYKGARIRYYNDKKQIVSVSYFQQNLLSEPMKKSVGLSLYLKNFDTAFFKASMYAPHSLNSFGEIVNHALNATYIVQPDDGIPLDTIINTRAFDISLFGLYTKPHSMFGVSTQNSLTSKNWLSICAVAPRNVEEEDLKFDALKKYEKLWGANYAAKNCPDDASERMANLSIEWRGYLGYQYGYSSMSGPDKSIRMETSNLIYAKRK